MNAAQQREERIQQLYEYFKEQTPDLIDPILLQAKKMFPLVRVETLQTYAEAVMRLLKSGK